MRVRDDDDVHFPIPPMRLPGGTVAQLACMRAAADGLKHQSRRDLERLVRAVAEEVNAKAKEE